MKNKNKLVERKAFVDTVGIKIKCADLKNESVILTTIAERFYQSTDCSDRSDHMETSLYETP